MTDKGRVPHILEHATTWKWSASCSAQRAPGCSDWRKAWVGPRTGPNTSEREKSSVPSPACSLVTMTMLSLLLLLYHIHIHLKFSKSYPVLFGCEWNHYGTSVTNSRYRQTFSAIRQSSQLGTTAENRLQIILRTIQISCLSLATGNCYFPIVFLSKTVLKLCMHLTYLAQR